MTPLSFNPSISSSLTLNLKDKIIGLVRQEGAELELISSPFMGPCSIQLKFKDNFLFIFATHVTLVVPNRTTVLKVRGVLEPLWNFFYRPVPKNNINILNFLRELNQESPSPSKPAQIDTEQKSDKELKNDAADNEDSTDESEPVNPIENMSISSASTTNSEATQKMLDEARQTSAPDFFQNSLAMNPEERATMREALGLGPIKK